jgi:hypothetical protein
MDWLALAVVVGVVNVALVAFAIAILVVMNRR